MQKPSIVAPGGSLEKAIIALHYGADAVYVGAQQFSLRKSASNLTNAEIKHLCKIAHGLNKRVYLALNIFPHEKDIKPLQVFLDHLEDIPLDACIVSDIGMAQLIKNHTTIPIHASTQASILNTETALFWKNLGAKRVVLAREASLEEACKIKKETNLEIELFIHGAMCSSFSGKCTISNVASGRDSNRGGCIQSCRHEYELSNGETHHIMNSKDLMGLAHIPAYFSNQIDAVKIEGRMKSALYVATACQQYKQAINNYSESQSLFNSDMESQQDRLSNVSNRGFTDASLAKKAGKSSISYDWNGYNKSLEFIGIVKETSGNKSLIQTKQAFSSDDAIMVITPNSPQMEPIGCAIESLKGVPLTHVSPNQHVWLNTPLKNHGILIKQ
ncbi:MAG: peptidase U32 family protein [Candidatus Margulisiibacteriota bacterium]|nr:peptidase U32 family protein [Candidatus Margulisiibacteriota bacterium]